MKDGISQIILNIELQKDEPAEYNILNRAVFYASRLVSSQKERDFVKSNFNDIRRVFSIWICLNMDENSMDYIHLTDDKLLGSCQWKGGLDIINIVMIGVSSVLPEHDETYDLHRLLGTLFSKEMSASDRLDIIGTEYHIPVDEGIRKDVSIMCNLSQGIKEDAITTVILNMYENDFTIEQIALATKKSVEDIKAVIKKEKPVLV